MLRAAAIMRRRIWMEVVRHASDVLYVPAWRYRVFSTGT
jgi:hypothetical protein